MNAKNDDASKRIDYISDDEEDVVVLELDESNYYELAYTYLNWKNNGGYKKCRKCGRLFRVKTGPMKKKVSNSNEKTDRAQLCWDCTEEYEAKYKGKDVMSDNYEPRTVECIDCGKIVYLEKYVDSRTCRCEECYCIHRRKNKTETMRQLRAKQ
jgi:hypothetical protein